MTTITHLQVHNIGPIGDVDIRIDKPLVLFYGEIRQGKTTLLNAVRWAFGGAFPDDILRHGQDEGHIQIDLSNASLRREFYRAKDGTTKARAITFIRDGQAIKKPVDELRKLLNPFHLDPNHFAAKSDRDRRAFLLSLMPVDTAEHDAAIETLESKASTLRAEIKAAGEIDTAAVAPPPDEQALKNQRAAALEEWEEEKARVEALKNAAWGRAQMRAVALKRQAEIAGEMDALEVKLAELHAESERLGDALEANPEIDAPEPPARPDTSWIDDALADAKAQAVRYEAYQQRLQQAVAVERKRADLREMKAQTRDLRAERLSKLSEASAACPIPGLRYDEQGWPVYEDTAMDMLSTSQLMDLSHALSGLYPEGLGIELLDRGESLGESIFAYVEEARKHERTILATIVGRRPAQVPEDVGVFVVKDGTVE